MPGTDRDMDALHLITIRESATAEVTASGAKLVVRIAGQSFFTGREAFRKATEVATLVAALKELGLPEDDVHLLNVSTEVASGILSKSSSALYVLEVNCQSAELLGRLLAAVSTQKNAKIAAISWQYPEIEKTKGGLIQEAVRGAKHTAHTVAEALGVPLLGVHRLSYDVTGLDTDLHVSEQSDHIVRRRSKAKSSALERLELAHVASVVVTVSAEFMVDTFTQNDP